MSGSGGGSSGAVTYPSYMSGVHGRWLDDSGTDNPNNSLVDTINTAYNNSPFTGLVAFDPDFLISHMDEEIALLLGQLSAIQYTSSFNTALANAAAGFLLGSTTLGEITVSDADINADVVALDDILTEQLEQRDLPRFQAGMLNIGAINTSAFIIGEALMRGMKNRDVARHGSQLRITLNAQVRTINAEHLRSYNEISAKLYIHHQEIIRNATVDMLNVLMQKANLVSTYTHMSVDTDRIKTVMKKEELEEQTTIDEADAKWNIELFKHGANMLAGPSGGVVQGPDKKSKAVMALGGGLSGAAAGAAIGTAYGTAASPGIGTAIGALLGVGMAFL